MKSKFLAAGSSDTVRSRSITGKPARMLRTAWTNEWDRADTPDPLGMPLQTSLVGEPLSRINQARPEPGVEGPRPHDLVRRTGGRLDEQRTSRRVGRHRDGRGVHRHGAATRAPRGGVIADRHADRLITSTASSSPSTTENPVRQRSPSCWSTASAAPGSTGPTSSTARQDHHVITWTHRGTATGSLQADPLDLLIRTAPHSDIESPMTERLGFDHFHLPQPLDRRHHGAALRADPFRGVASLVAHRHARPTRRTRFRRHRSTRSSPPVGTADRRSRRAHRPARPQDPTIAERVHSKAFDMKSGRRRSTPSGPSSPCSRRCWTT